MDISTLATTRQAAAYLGVTRGRIVQYITDGLLTGGIKLAYRDWLIPWDRVKAFQKPNGRRGPKPGSIGKKKPRKTLGK